jgi:hypothetical protein
MTTTTMERKMMNDATVAVVIIESMALMVCGYNVHGMNPRGAVLFDPMRMLLVDLGWKRTMR